MPVRPPSSRSGFSLIEAMMVLIIGSVALMMVFAIGGRAAQTGFGLGGRALAVGDRQLAEDSLRTLIAGLSIPPRGASAAKLGMAQVQGSSAGFEGDAILHRSGLCGEAGPVRELAVTIGPGGKLRCRTGAGHWIDVLDLRSASARFSYSPDGSQWVDHWPLFEDADAPPGAPTHPASLFIRLADDRGDIDITGRAGSGRPSVFTAASPPAAGASQGGL